MTRLLAVDGIATPFYEEYKKAIDAHKGQQVALTVERKGTDGYTACAGECRWHTWICTGRVDSETLDSLGLIRIEKTQYSFFGSFPAGVHLAVEKLSSYIDQFKKILSPKTEAYKGVGGFKAMGSIFPSMWDWQSFWTITAFFSIALAFMNILPDTGPRWRSCALHRAGNDHRPQTQPEAAGIRPGCRYGALARPDDLRKWK